MLIVPDCSANPRLSLTRPTGCFNFRRYVSTCAQVKIPCNSPCLIRTPVPFAAGVSPALPKPIVKCFTLSSTAPATSSGMKTLVIKCPRGRTGHIGGAVSFAIRVQESRLLQKRFQVENRGVLRDAGKACPQSAIERMTLAGFPPTRVLWGNVLGDYETRRNTRVFAHRHSADDRSAGSDPCVSFNHEGLCDCQVAPPSRFE